MRASILWMKKFPFVFRTRVADEVQRDCVAADPCTFIMGTLFSVSIIFLMEWVWRAPNCHTAMLHHHQPMLQHWIVSSASIKKMTQEKEREEKRMPTTPQPVEMEMSKHAVPTANNNISSHTSSASEMCKALARVLAHEHSIACVCVRAPAASSKGSEHTHVSERRRRWAECRMRVRSYTFFTKIPMQTKPLLPWLRLPFLAALLLTTCVCMQTLFGFSFVRSFVRTYEAGSNERTGQAQDTLNWCNKIKTTSCALPNANLK